LGHTHPSTKRYDGPAKLDAAGLAAATKALADFKVRAPDPSANEAPAPAGGWDGKDAPQSTRPSTPTPVGAASGKGAHV